MYKVFKNPGSEEDNRFRPHFFRQIGTGGPAPPEQERPEEEKKFVPLCPLEGDLPSPEPEDQNSEEENLLREIQEKAMKQGFEKGERAGRESERKRLEHLLDALEKAVSELNRVKQELYRSAETEAVELALAIAEKVVFHEVSVNRETVLDVLRNALDKVDGREEIRIRVNSEDLKIMNESGFEVKEEAGNIREVIVEGDDTIERGGCLIETGFGNIDARLHSRLQAVEDLLRSQMP